MPVWRTWNISPILEWVTEEKYNGNLKIQFPFQVMYIYVNKFIVAINYLPTMVLPRR